MKKKVILIAGIIALVSGTALKAQVTIGSDTSPNPGAILDVKNNNNETNARGGIIFPRVNITNFKPTSDVEFALSIGGTGSWDRQTHTGLVVYNTGTPSGLYIWDGSKWEELTAVTAANGLSKDGTAIKLGGSLTETTTTITGNAQSIVFDLQNIADDKGLFIKDMPHLITDRHPLAVDVTTGKLGILSGESEAKIAFLQSNDYSYLSSYVIGGSADGINNTRTRTIPWNIPTLSAGIPSLGGDMVTNNLVEFDPSDNSFVLLEDVAVELSGYIGYGANVSDPSPSGSGGNNGAGITIVNASIQVKFVGRISFQNYSSVRAVYTNDMTPYRQTLNIPPAMLVGKTGDKIRMVVIPQPSALGIPHTAPAVVTPFGSDFCKSLKIIAQ